MWHVGGEEGTVGRAGRRAMARVWMVALGGGDMACLGWEGKGGNER